MRSGRRHRAHHFSHGSPQEPPAPAGVSSRRLLAAAGQRMLVQRLLVPLKHGGDRALYLCLTRGTWRAVTGASLRCAG